MPDKLLSRIKSPRSLHMPVPSYVQIEPTFKCNLSCLHCFRSFYTREKLSLSSNTFKLILSQLPGLEVVKLQGFGEPLLYEDLETVLKIGREKGIEFITVSNGTMIKEEKVDMLLYYFSDFYFSIDSINPHVFSSIRKGADLSLVLGNMKLFYNKKKKYGTKIGINFVINHENYNEILLLKDFSQDYGIDIITLVEVENWFLPSQKHYMENREYVMKTRAYSSVIEEYVRELSDFCLNHGTEVYFVESKKRKDSCLWPFYLSCITCDGYVIPCCNRANTGLSGMGNIFKNEFKDIWNGDKYIDLRRAILERTPSATCDTCPD